MNKDSESNLYEKKISSEDVFKGKILNVKRDKVELPNGHTTYRELIRHVGAVCIVPVTDDYQVVVERQYRYPLDMIITEIPAGKLDSFEEDRLSAAKRELREETGFEASDWLDMGIYYPAAAYTDEKITMYLAKGLKAGKQELDRDEFLNVKLVPLRELIDEIMDGKIKDGKTQVALLKAARHLGLM